MKLKHTDMIWICKGLEVLRAVDMKCSIFWHAVRLKSSDVSEEHVASIFRAWQAELGCYILHAGFLICLFFDPDDGGDMFLRNVG
jgi:hypothetical protein